MSVIAFSQKEIADIYKTVIATKDFKRAVINNYDRITFERLYKDSSINDKIKFEENIIINWLQRLFISNQLAFELNYNKSLSIELDKLDPKIIESGSIINTRALYSQLSSLDYNLYDNNGRSFTDESDIKRLNRLKNRVLKQLAKI